MRPPRPSGILAALLSGCAGPPDAAAVGDSAAPAPVFTHLATLSQAGGPQIAGDGDHLAVLGEQLSLVDIADPRAPALVASHPMSGGAALDVQLGSGRVWLAYESAEAGGSGVAVLDPLDGRRTAWIGAPIEAAHSLLVSADRLYVADSTARRVHVFDIRDPDAPAFLASWTPPHPASRPDELALDGSRLYVGARTGLGVLDVSGDPVTLGWGPYASEQLHSVAAAGAAAYTSDESVPGALVAWDVSGQPAQVAAVEDTVHPMIHALAIDDGTLFAAWYERGLQAWTLDDPAAPVLAGTADTCGCGGEGSGVEGRGAYAVWAGAGIVATVDADAGLMLYGWGPPRGSGEADRPAAR